MASRLQVCAGGLLIGGGAPVSVQSMTTTPTKDAAATRAQIRELATAGAALVRVSVPDEESARALPEIMENTPVPLAADIHFQADLALLSLDAGIHKLRLNPGNIRRRKDVRRIAERAAELNVPIRIGVNSGSIPGDVREKYGSGVDGLWAAAERHLELLGETGFTRIVVSIKASDPMLTVSANLKAASLCDHPLHLGVTEAGPPSTAGVRSAVAMALLLSRGVGDTIRVSSSGSPLVEPPLGLEILSSLGLLRRARVVSCPTCARARLDVAALAEEVSLALRTCETPITVAVMGCEVNGPGEAREADIALIGTPTGILLWLQGKAAGEVAPEQALQTLMREIARFSAPGGNCERERS